MLSCHGNLHSNNLSPRSRGWGGFDRSWHLSMAECCPTSGAVSYDSIVWEGPYCFDSVISQALLLSLHVLAYTELNSMTKLWFLILIRKICFRDPSDVTAVSTVIQHARAKHTVCFSTTAARPWLSSMATKCHGYSNKQLVSQYRHRGPQGRERNQKDCTMTQV